MTNTPTQTTYRLKVYCFKRKDGEIAPAFGIFPTRDAAGALKKVTKLLQRDYKIVRATLVYP